MEQWFVYIVECSDKTFYVGTTNNVELRIEKHNTGKGAKYTKGRGPVTLKYVLECETHSEACKKEYELKQYSRVEKIKLIQDGQTHKESSVKAPE